MIAEYDKLKFVGQSEGKSGTRESEFQFVAQQVLNK